MRGSAGQQQSPAVQRGVFRTVDGRVRNQGAGHAAVSSMPHTGQRSIGPVRRLRASQVRNVIVPVYVRLRQGDTGRAYSTHGRPHQDAVPDRQIGQVQSAVAGWTSRSSRAPAASSCPGAAYGLSCLDRSGVGADRDALATSAATGPTWWPVRWRPGGQIQWCGRVVGDNVHDGPRCRASTNGRSRRRLGRTTGRARRGRMARSPLWANAAQLSVSAADGTGRAGLGRSFVGLGVAGVHR
jgi:hypothetical protein